MFPRQRSVPLNPTVQNPSIIQQSLYHAALFTHPNPFATLRESLPLEERPIETALDGQIDYASARTLTLDGAVKCVQGRLTPPSLLEKFENLQHLSIANIRVSSLELFPRGGWRV
ncbi:hypothetical protein PanWU01x14_165000 [Parasponia andersonii]|uniref:LRR domain containing protein n=1 Tax=Parasponia andersonii TaxID=3476 RepID=A0A2P5CC24_PARAD|nr:hypothetical protein PanWU01x14_165000 [Parasponia andersonii]